MKILLDTHIFLWYLADAPQLSTDARARIARADEVYVSAASVWEAAIKVATGRLKVDIHQLIEEIPRNGFVELSVQAGHCAAVATLPHHHRDPFDRLLIAQALHEPLQLVTADKVLQQYSDLVIVI